MADCAKSGASGCQCAACCAQCGQPWRFKTGDRVLARYTIGGDGWHAGTVHTTNYVEPEHGRVVPYDIKLDSTCRHQNLFVSAPYDSDTCVRTLEGAAPTWVAKELNCSDCARSCPLHHVCEDKLDCPKYHFCGKEGRVKTRMWRKLAERRQKKCPDCANGSCDPVGVDRGEASVLNISSFDRRKDGATVCTAITAQGAAAGAKRSKKKKKKKKRSKRRVRGIAARAESRAQNSRLEDEAAACNRCCECDCHEIAALGRQAVVAKLQEGVDFSSLFQDDVFEHANEHELAELAAFKRRLVRAETTAAGFARPARDLANEHELAELAAFQRRLVQAESGCALCEPCIHDLLEADADSCEEIYLD